MILGISCASCGQDICQYIDNLSGRMQLYCMPCGSKKFYAYHHEETKETISRVKLGLMKLKNVNFTDFDTVLETVSEDFNTLLKHL